MLPAGDSGVQAVTIIETCTKTDVEVHQQLNKITAGMDSGPEDDTISEGGFEIVEW